MKVNRESAKSSIKEQFALAADEAEEYMKRYWNESAETSE